MKARHLPLPGTAVEALGVLGSYVGGDMMSSGEIYFTVQASAPNVRLIASKLECNEVPCVAINERLVQVPLHVCKWRSAPAGGLFDVDGQTMLGLTDSCVAGGRAAFEFQALLSRRNRA